MKKFLSLIVFVAFATIAASAQLYLVGSGVGLGWDPANPMELEPKDDGSYEVTIQDLESFKLSTSKGTWYDFNNTARCVRTDILVPGTYVLYSGEANIVVPWKGEWTLSINEYLGEINLSTTTPNPGSFDFYIRGVMNGWGVSDDWKFELNEDYDYVLRDVTILAGQEFKIADANYGTINYGTTDNMIPGADYILAHDSFNCTLSFDFTGNVYFSLMNKVVRFGDAKYLCVIGDYCNWDNKKAVFMERVDNSNVYTCRFEDGLTGSFKIMDGTWNYSFGSLGDSGNVNCLVGKNDAKFNGSNWKVETITRPVVLTFTLVEGSDFDGSNELSSLVLSYGDTVGVEGITTENEVSVQYYNLQGVPVAYPEKGLYIVNKGGKVYKTLLR